MGKMHSYPHHIGDFAKATKGLTLTERGAYRELLDQYYAHEGPLPLGKRERYRLAGAATIAERVAVDYVVERYFVEGADGWHQHRADQEIARYRVRQVRGSAGADKRWRGHARGVLDACSEDARPMLVPCLSDARPMLGECLADASPMPTKTNNSNNGSVTSTEGARVDWMASAEAVVAKGKSVSIEARPGETWQALRARILRALAARKGRQGDA